MPKLSPRAATVVHRSSTSSSSSSSPPKPRALKGVLIALGTSAAIVFVSLSGGGEPRSAGGEVRSDAARAAEADTRALLDERTALHLHKLRL